MAYPEFTAEREASRHRAIAALDLVDTPPEAEFDALATLAAELLGCPMGMVTLVERDRQWIKAAFGATLKETTRDDAFCAYTIAQDDSMVVADATLDPRFADNMFVVGAPEVRFYAGTPISARDPKTNDMVPIGAVCVLDTAPRELTEREQGLLDHLRAVAEALLKARAVANQAEVQSEELKRKERVFHKAERMAAMGSWRVMLDDESLHWSEGVFRIYGLEASNEPPMSVALEPFPPRDRAIITGAIANTIETGEPFDVEVDFITARGRNRRVRSMGEMELREGKPYALVGLFQDVTERHEIEESLRRSASIDELTRISNRAAFSTELERSLVSARNNNEPLALAMIDLDLFKGINDTHGHLVGDDVLRAFARRLKRAHPDGFAARLGGDEFGLLIPGVQPHAVAGVIERLLEELKIPVHSGELSVPTSGTIGYAMLEEDVTSVRDFVHRADSALYAAKRRARGTAQAWGAMRNEDRRQRA